MFIKTHNTLRYTSSPVKAFKEIPVGNWLVKYDKQNDEFYLEKTPEFSIPKKVYGNSKLLANRYLNTFNISNKNVGVLLTGLKGTGKSLTAKITCIESNLPVILITEDFKGDVFKAFINNIKQEVVIFIDEFEKIYNKEEKQDAFLSILDGVFEGKKLFLFTSNERNRINSHMLNRLGRIRYLNEYNSLENSVINEVIEDLLENKEYIEELNEIMDILAIVSMDMLVFLIDEINTYKESPKEVMKYLNLRPDDSNYSVDVFVNKVKEGVSSIRHHPLKNDTMFFEYYNKKREWEELEINLKESTITREEKTIIIECQKNIKLVCKPKEVYSYKFF